MIKSETCPYPLIINKTDVAKSTSATLSKGGGVTDGEVPLPVI